MQGNIGGCSRTFCSSDQVFRRGFRGNDELLESPHNINYLGILELISQFDPFLAEYITTHGQKGRGSLSYVSSTTCKKFIDLMGEKKQASNCRRAS